MTKLSTILITFVLLGFLAVPPCGGAGAVSSPPPPSAPPPPYTADDLQPYTIDSDGNTNYNVSVYPFLLVTGVRDDGTSIMEAPPQWMLDGPPPEPTTMTIRLKFYDTLNSNALYTVEYTCPRTVAFAGWEIVEE